MSFTERAGLFPVLLLTGCAQPAVITGPPSASVVDSMLSRSAADISAMQYRIHQSGPSAKRPISASTAKPTTSLLSQTSPSAIHPAKTPQAAVVTSSTGTGPADGFVRQGGAAPTLRAALRKIVPAEQKIVFKKDVSPDTPQLWQWTGNDRWPYVVDKLLKPRGLKATVNTKAKTVTVETAQRAQTTVVPVRSGSAIAPGTKKSTSSPSSGRNPFHDNASARPQPIAKAVAAVSTVPVIPPAAVQLRHWRIEAGSTVKDWLYSQAAAEKCTVQGIKNWTVAWLTPVNYRVDAPLVFEGNFRDMLNQLFTLYGTAKVPLYAGTRAVQCVVKVDDKEVQ